MKIVHIGSGKQDQPEWMEMLGKALSGLDVQSLAIVALYKPEGNHDADLAVFNAAISKTDDLYPFMLIGGLEVAKAEILKSMEGFSD